MIKQPYLSPKQKDLLLWVGLCITEWAQIEYLLFRLTMEVLGVGPKRGAIIYKSTTQIKARITLINELVKAVLDETDPIIEGKHKSGLHHSWDSIYKNLNNHLELRNKLAHWPTVTNRSGDPVLHYSSIEVYKGKLNPEAVEEIDVAKMSLHYELIEQVQQKLKVFLPEFSLRMRQIAFLQRERVRSKTTKFHIR
jgi:hypothetical protein